MAIDDDDRHEDEDVERDVGVAFLLRPKECTDGGSRKSGTGGPV